MDHDNMAMTSTVASMTMAMTGSAATATATPSSMGGMSMGSSSCKISMLWNWNTVGACFISREWRITSTGMFAGSCIGVILLVLSLEFLRRLGKEYDRFVIRQHQRAVAVQQVSSTPKSSSTSPEPNGSSGPSSIVTPNTFRPNVVQQAIRALLHMLQFAVAYFVMLLAMYYNGYFIICIFIGAFLGYFIFSWESMSLGQEQYKEDPTVCCG